MMCQLGSRGVAAYVADERYTRTKIGVFGVISSTFPTASYTKTVKIDSTEWYVQHVNK